MLKRKFVALWLISLGLSSCAKVHIKDGEICADLGRLGATCNHVLSDQARDISKDQWDEERFSQMCMVPETWANIKESLLKLCNDTKRCTFEEVEAIEKVGSMAEDMLVMKEDYAEGLLD